MRRTNFVGMAGLALTLALLVTACVEYKSTAPTAPSDVAKVLTAGSWISSSTSAATTFSPGTCGGFEWTITSLTATTASGTFKAVCAGGMVLQGTADGSLNGLVGTINARGTATTNGVGCPFTLSATVVPQTTDSVKATYTGTVCGISVSGTEVLKRP